MKRKTKEQKEARRLRQQVGRAEQCRRELMAHPVGRAVLLGQPLVVTVPVSGVVRRHE